MLCGPDNRRGFTLIELLIVIAIIVMLMTLLVGPVNQAKQYAIRATCRSNLHELMIGWAAYAGENKLWLPGPKGIVDETAETPPGDIDDPSDPYWGWRATISTETGLLHTGGYVTNPKVWLCANAELRGPGDWYRQIGESNVLTAPWTYHYTINARTYGVDEGEDDPYRYNDYDGDRRQKLTLFNNPGQTIGMGEENTGMLPYGTSSGECEEVLNDTDFIEPDMAEPRHLGASQVGYLDGHADQVPALTKIYEKEYCP